jgi:hypothetical protein
MLSRKLPLLSSQISPPHDGFSPSNLTFLLSIFSGRRALRVDCVDDVALRRPYTKLKAKPSFLSLSLLSLLSFFSFLSLSLLLFLV